MQDPRQPLIDIDPHSALPVLESSKSLSSDSDSTTIPPEQLALQAQVDELRGAYGLLQNDLKMLYGSINKAHAHLDEVIINKDKGTWSLLQAVDHVVKLVKMYDRQGKVAGGRVRAPRPQPYI